MSLSASGIFVKSVMIHQDQERLKPLFSLSHLKN